MIDNKLLNEIKDYCKLNDISDINHLINKMLKQGFTIEKFGHKPEGVNENSTFNTDSNDNKLSDEKSVNKYSIDNEKGMVDNKNIKDADMYGE